MYVKYRPGLFEMLDILIEHYELVVYTGSDKDYANYILDKIESKRKYFEYRLYNSQCIVEPNLFVVKCLEILSFNRSWENLLAVDNYVSNFSVNILNYLPILEFKEANIKSDRALIGLTKYLMELKDMPDVRIKIKHDIGCFLASIGC